MFIFIILFFIFKIFRKIESLNFKCLRFEVTVLSAEYLSNCSFRIPDPYNLNEVSHDSAINLIYKLLDQGLKLKKIYVDTVGPKDKY